MTPWAAVVPRDKAPARDSIRGPSYMVRATLAMTMGKSILRALCHNGRRRTAS